MRHGLRPWALLTSDARNEFAGLLAESQDEADSVLVGLAPEMFDYANLTSAFRVLHRVARSAGAQAKPRLIAVHRGRVLRTSDKELSLGPGPFVAALEYAAGMDAVVVGKPSREFFQLALESAALDPSRTVSFMVGDDVRDDALGAAQAGLQGVLVRTGKFTAGDEQLLRGKDNTHVCNSFAEFVQRLEDGSIWPARL